MSELFDAAIVPRELAAATDDIAWVEAMLDVEDALAAVQADAGAIPADAASAITAARHAIRLDPAVLGEQAFRTGTPAEPVVRALREAVGGDAAQWVHHGATSQDVMDTAAMLVARRALAEIEPLLEGIAEACAVLADAHRASVMTARTLLQPALPTTFGLVAARWMIGVDDARDRLRGVPLPAQLGGPAGTLDAAVATALARRLSLTEPVLPWHTLRGPVHRLAGALDEAAGAVGKIALDLVLLAQAEVGEVREPADGRGGSSSLAHKRNPIGSVLALAAARRVHAAATLLTGTMLQEHERAATGAWHAEWVPLGEALALTGGAANAVAGAFAGLEIDTERMRANLAAHGLPADPGSTDSLIDRALARHRG